MRKYFRFAAGIMVLFGALLTARAEIYTAYLSPAQQNPPVPSTAFGRGIVVVDPVANTLTFTIVFNGLTSNQILSHIHAPASVGGDAPVIIDFGAIGGTSGTISGTRSITLAQINQLRQGLGYINVHSANFGGGEIRGQLAKQRPVDYDGDGRSDFSVWRCPTVAPPAPAPITYFNLNSTTGFQAVNFGDGHTDRPAPGDYDGDGKDDFGIYRVGTAPGNPSFTFLLRSASCGAFQSTQWGISGDQTVSRDYDGDGKTDIAIFRRGPSPGASAVWYILQSTTNTLRSAAWGTTGVSIDSGDLPVPGDYDGDGTFDLAVYRFGGLVPDNTFIILRSSDSGVVFQPWGNHSTDLVTNGDFDGDGKSDFVAVRFGTPFMWFVLRSSNGSVLSTTFGAGSDRVALGDYDGDSRIDIAVYRGSISGSAFYVINSLTNTFQAQSWGGATDFPVATFDVQ